MLKPKQELPLADVAGFQDEAKEAFSRGGYRLFK